MKIYLIWSQISPLKSIQVEIDRNSVELCNNHGAMVWKSTLWSQEGRQNTQRWCSSILKNQKWTENGRPGSWNCCSSAYNPWFIKVSWKDLVKNSVNSIWIPIESEIQLDDIQESQRILKKPEIWMDGNLHRNCNSKKSFCELLQMGLIRFDKSSNQFSCPPG